jgi:flagellar hook protein FlgE
VDLAEQSVRLIAAQRAFQANSKTITTADQLLSELIAMKR